MPRASLLLLRSHDLFFSPSEAYRRVLDHIGLPPHPLPIVHQNAGSSPLVPRIREAALPFFTYREQDLIAAYGIGYTS